MTTNEEILGLRAASAVTQSRATRVGTAAPRRGRRAKTRVAGAPIALLTAHSQDGPIDATWFHYYDPAAKEVFLAGSFNGWNPAATPMFLGAAGEWCAELRLPPGAYEYRLVVDGVWKDDPKAAATRPNPFGGCNAVKTVEPIL